MNFLKAEWRKLAIANYVVDPGLLANYLPAKTEIDLWRGSCYVSLVGFMFLNTKIMGFPVPFHRNFEEVNLRFYVRYQHHDIWKRGVVFIREFVPRPALTWVANTLYQEHYKTSKMAHSWEVLNDIQVINYRWQLNGIHNSFLVRAALNPIEIPADSEAEFITEHYWGYTRIGHDKTFEYEVSHPRWTMYEVFDQEINVDFALLYGKEFSSLTTLVPTSVMLAEGSEITVKNKNRI